MEKLILILLSFHILFLLGGCNSSGGLSNEGSVISVDDEDEEMNAAMAQAKSTFGYFVENWKNPRNDGYSVKVAMPTADQGVEHIWFNPISIEGNRITAECANDPVEIEGLKMGDVRTVDRSSISDWMIIVGNQCYGGYTVRVLAKRQPGVAPPFDFVDVTNNP